MKKSVKTLHNTASSNARKINAVQEELHTPVREKIDTARRANLITMALAMGSLISCGNDFNDMMKEPTGGGGGTLPGSVAVTGVSLNKSTVTTLTTLGTESLAATIMPANATDKTVSWQSSNPGVATVSSTGEVQGVGDGIATITVTTTDGSHTAACAVAVNLTSISGTTPTRTAYGLNSLEADDPIDLTGMVLTLTFGGSSSTVTFSPTDPLFGGVSNFTRTSATTGSSTTTAVVTYGGKMATITGLQVKNIVAKRTSSPAGYYGYDTLSDALPGSSGSGESGQTATITLYASETLSAPIIVKETSDITLIGNGQKTITGYTSDSALFTISTSLTAGCKLTLGKPGETTNTITIKDHDRSSSGPYGGAVFVGTHSEFILNDGTISDNDAKGKDGGGVYVGGNNSKFTMNGGTISGNKASTSSGGGVFVADYGTFTWNAGTISGNTAGYEGGGVLVSGGGTFTWNSGATITSNTCNATNGQQVYKNNHSGVVTGSHASVSSPTGGTNASGNEVYWD